MFKGIESMHRRTQKAQEKDKHAKYARRQKDVSSNEKGRTDRK